MGKDNQAEFDTQLVALTKILVDSINEKEITKDLKTLKENDKGITKLEKFFVKRDLGGFESYIKFLRVLQDLRSKSAARRKGSNYDKLIEDLQLENEGQRILLSYSRRQLTSFSIFGRTYCLGVLNRFTTGLFRRLSHRTTCSSNFLGVR